MKLTGEEDDAQVSVKRAVQIVLKTARQVIINMSHIMLRVWCHFAKRLRGWWPRITS